MNDSEKQIISNKIKCISEEDVKNDYEMLKNMMVTTKSTSVEFLNCKARNFLQLLRHNLYNIHKEVVIIRKGLI